MKGLKAILGLQFVLVGPASSNMGNGKSSMNGGFFSRENHHFPVPEIPPGEEGADADLEERFIPLWHNNTAFLKSTRPGRRLRNELENHHFY